MAKRRKKTQSLLSGRRPLYAVLGFGFILVVFIGSSLFFSTIGTYDLGIGTSWNDIEVIGPDGIIYEEYTSEHGLKLVLYLFEKTYPVIDDSGVFPEIEGTTAQLLCIDNDIVVSTASGSFYYRQSGQYGEEVVPYFVLSLNGVYSGEFNYKVRLVGELETETFSFKIVGREESLEPPENGEPATLVPVFVSTPPDTVYMLSNETIDLVWVVYSENPGSYEVRITSGNETIIRDGLTNKKEFPFTLTMANFASGDYTIIYTYTDAIGNTISDSVVLSVDKPPSVVDNMMDDPMMLMVIVLVAVVLLGGGASRR